MTYYLLVTYFFSCLYASVPIAKEIADGTLSGFLIRPASYLWYQYWQALARRSFRLLAGFPVVVGVFLFLGKHTALPTDVGSYILLLFTVFGAVNILFLFDVLIACAEFWMTNSDSVGAITDNLISFLSGALIPLFFLPGIFQQVANFFPFKYAGFFIVNTFLGRESTEGILTGLGIQGLWILILTVVVVWVWRKGLRKYEAFGG